MRFAAPATLLLFAVACGPDPDLEAAPAWALNWAEVTPSESGLAGFQVWQFYVEGWEEKHEDDFFKCDINQQLEGSITSCPQAGIPNCYAAYELTLSAWESDCPEGLAADSGFDGPPWMAIGALPLELEEDAPYDDGVLGWYIGYDDGTVLAHGYASAKVIEDGGQPAGVGWLNDELYVLWPAYVWEL